MTSEVNGWNSNEILDFQKDFMKDYLDISKVIKILMVGI